MVTAPATDVGPPRFITADELAELLSVSRSHVFKLAQDRAIPSVKIGRSVRFELGAVLQALRGAA